MYPSLLQINTRVWLTGLSSTIGRQATLDDIADADLDQLAAKGFDWIWLLSVWQTGEAGKRISRTQAEWQEEFRHTLPDLQEQDIAGSGFAITAYEVHKELGGRAALARLRERLKKRKLKLMLDFVPNHVAPDHPWIESHPDFFIHSSEELLARFPKNYVRIKAAGVDAILAHGRDPYFPGWPDTLQLNYGNEQLQEAQIGELRNIASQCDGVRCDMAMLVLPDIFEQTWGIQARSFWPEATRRVRESNPGFLFMAEVYWDLEWTLQQQGFDYTYDKRLYDRLREGHAKPVREHLQAEPGYQNKMARFLENHDEPRAAATFSAEMHPAAAIISFLTPGLRFFHQGQFEGRKKRISPHLVRAPKEEVDSSTQQFYSRLLEILQQPAFRDGAWQLLPCWSVWDGNYSNDNFIAYAWTKGKGRFLVTVNYSHASSQCFVKLPFEDLRNKKWQLKDLIQGTTYERSGDQLVNEGLYLDEPGWKVYVFEFKAN